MSDLDLAAMEQDIVIVGGGMVGSVLAHALSRDGWRVTVLERATKGHSPSFDHRLTALSDASWRYLDDIGLIDSAADRRAQPICEVRVTDHGHFGMTRITTANNGGVALGRVMGNRALGEAIERARERSGTSGAIHMLQPAGYLGHQLEGTGTAGRIRVDIDYQGSSHTLTARLLIAADGAGSTVRAATEVPVATQAYGQTAIVCTALPARAHHGVAFECFTRGGPLAILPAPDGRVSVVWVNRDEQVSELTHLSDEDFARRLDHLFRHRLGGFSQLTPRHAYPLNLVTAQDLIEDRLVILGNAAHALHPVAGQGFNLCLRDVRDLAVHLRADRGEFVDPGDPARLAAYAEQRRSDYRRTIGLTDRLVRGFSLDLPGLGMVRGAILSAFDGLVPAKNRLVRLTRGL
ncbi:FAD-dependent oxidoreductase [Halothiobacillus diazotrophicus]|nr:FAD-dependent oxidoreductase [Halothiobacillus diazotrophicus]